MAELVSAKTIASGLRRRGSSLQYLTSFIGRYPYDWRTKKPTIFRATDQWFASVDNFREAAMSAIEQVHDSLMCSRYFLRKASRPRMDSLPCSLPGQMDTRIRQESDLCDDFVESGLVHLEAAHMGRPYPSLLP